MNMFVVLCIYLFSSGILRVVRNCFDKLLLKKKKLQNNIPIRRLLLVHSKTRKYIYIHHDDVWKNKCYDPPSITFQTQLNRERERERNTTHLHIPPVSYTSMLPQYIYTFSKKYPEPYTSIIHVCMQILSRSITFQNSTEREREKWCFLKKPYVS